MPSTVPTPVAAVVGLVPAVLEGVLRLPGRAVTRVVQLPVLAISSTLNTLDAYRRGYDDLADRGERLIARLRGTSFDEVEDAVEDALQGTPVAGLYDRVEDTLEDVAEGAEGALRSVTGAARRTVGAAGDVAQAAGEAAGDVAGAVGSAAGQVAEAAGSAAGDLAQAAGSAASDVADAAGDAAQAASSAAGDAAQAAGGAVAAAGQEQPAEQPAAEQPKGVPTPRASQPDTTRVDSAASQQVRETVEQAAGGDVPVLEHDQLPLADYDHMTLGSLRGRLRSLSVEQLVQVRAYERAHADRLPVVTMLDNRIAKLLSDPSAQPTGTVSTEPAPEQRVTAQGGSRVSPATTGPKINPPSQGVPTNPGQPR